MVSPQVENGFTRIANELVEALAKTRIPGEARQVLDFILRQTYGWNRVSASISISEFRDGTGLARSHIYRAVGVLLEMGLIKCPEIGTQSGRFYRFNKDFHAWKSVPKLGRVPKLGQKCPEIGTKSVPELGQNNRYLNTLDIKKDLKTGKKKDIVRDDEKQSPSTIDNQATDKEIASSISSDQLKEAVQEIVAHLNQKTGASYRPTTPNTVSLIRARLTEKHTISDFKSVIDKKAAQWTGDQKMQRYLRPNTLFGSKFESYLNEPEVKNGGGLQADPGKYARAIAEGAGDLANGKVS